MANPDMTCLTMVMLPLASLVPVYFILGARGKWILLEVCQVRGMWRAEGERLLPCSNSVKLLTTEQGSLVH